MTSIAPRKPQDLQQKTRSVPEPVICLCRPMAAGQDSLHLDLAARLGWPIWTPSIDISYTDLGKWLYEFSTEHPDRPLLMLAPGLMLSPEGARKLAKLAHLSPGLAVYSVLSNAAQALNPFAGLDVSRIEESAKDQPPAPFGKTAEKTAALVNLLGTGGQYTLESWPEHLLYLPPEAIEKLSDEHITAANALSCLQARGGKLIVSDSLFAFDTCQALDQGPDLEPHEERRPAAWGNLVSSLANWLGSDVELAGLSLQPDTTTNLHITHSWGGGVAQWVESFIDADSDECHFQLRSEGPQTGQGAGQRLGLYVANELNTPIASWWLYPAIQSSSESNTQYRKILDRVCRRYGVGRVIVSSLVGHSLDAFATGLPTLQVLHDFYPGWPLLGVHPQDYLATPREQRLQKALQEHNLLADFQHREASQWNHLADAWREALLRYQVQLVAPSQSVIDLLRQLDEDWESIDITKIHHGVPAMPVDGPLLPRKRPDGRLRLVIPGRVAEGKGQSLLLKALSELTPLAQITLLGAGKNGQAFFGKPGVNVILQYHREALPGLMKSIAPDAAALLSVVPETFSYTLSEMKQLGIPVIATRVGSLAERIEDGHDGWLIEPDADALVAKVRELASDRAALESVRRVVGKEETFAASAMVDCYRKLCPAARSEPELLLATSDTDLQRNALAEQNARLQLENYSLLKRTEDLQKEVEQRSEWAREREQALLKEQSLRDHWVKALEEEQEQRKRWVSSLEAEIESGKDALKKERAIYDEALRDVRSQLDIALQSLSWRLTRPFRVIRRALANIKRTRLWHPGRWPFMLSLAVRTIHSKGLKGALLRLQNPRGTYLADTPGEHLNLEVSIGDPEPPKSMPRSDNPQASIIIPVFNKWEYTAACLRSIADAENEALFEVIVVDDCSKDETAQRLTEVDGLEVISNRKNAGFVSSCNRGAESARGQYIVMLNNDTQVMNGWLDALLETFTRFPDTGMAGARLVYPDGSLQEAGGIIFNDGSGWNYGRDDRAGRPEYNFTREADYCSGACIILSADVFRQLGGFDPRYAPAYYEDTDLAFKVREAGLKVRVQSAATIVHHEGITSGTDISSGTKRYQDVNRKKFLERWQTELAAFPAPIVDPLDRSAIRQARDYRLRGRVLVIDAYTPEPDQDSGSLRLRYLFDCFQQLGYGVSFLPDNRAFAGEYTTDLQKAGVEAIYSPWIESLADFFRNRGPEFDYIMICRHYVASTYLALIQKHCPQARFIFDTVDLHYLREERMAELENSLPLKRVAAQTRRSELAVIRQAAATLVVSPTEKLVLEKEIPEARIHVLTNIHRVSDRKSGFADRKDIFFVGGYQHPPNIDAAQWFVGNIWPLIREALPEINFHLIGSKAPEQVRALDGNGVVFHGFVKELDPWLDGCRMAIAPLRYGAGVKGKVNLSMSHGQPVVATSMAVEGLFARDGEDVLVADSAEDFASAVIRLYNDEALWNRLSTGSQENVQKYFSLDCARDSLRSLLGSLD